MPRSIHSDIVIDAAPERVWAALADFPAYPEWNPLMQRVSGTLLLGSRLAVTMHLPGKRGMTFHPTVLAADPPRELRWIGSLGVPGIFDGEHAFRIEPIDADRVRLVQEEQFTGVLAPVILRFIENATRQGFQEMNQALKRRVEGEPPA